MSFIHEHPALVAPRPVRLTAAAHHSIFRPSPVRLLSPPVDRAVEHTPDLDDSRHSADPSPRASPRSGLPSEALEEFLSILRPSMSIFPPTSPRRRGPNTLPAFQYERPSFNFKPRRIESYPVQKGDVEELDISRSSQPSRNALSPSPADVAATPDNEGVSNFFIDGESPAFRWFSSNVLASPVSRMHTRNPFLRHVSSQSPSPVGPLSPAAIPLPTPSPDELLDLC